MEIVSGKSSVPPKVECSFEPFTSWSFSSECKREKNTSYIHARRSFSIAKVIPKKEEKSYHLTSIMPTDISWNANAFQCELWARYRFSHFISSGSLVAFAIPLSWRFNTFAHFGVLDRLTSAFNHHCVCLWVLNLSAIKRTRMNIRLDCAMVLGPGCSCDALEKLVLCMCELP